MDLVDHDENTEVAWCTLDKVYEHFEELAQIPSGMYPPLFEYLDRVLVMRILRSDQGRRGDSSATWPTSSDHPRR